MVAVDKAYIPALALSGQPDQAAKAKGALEGFFAAWKDFKDWNAAEKLSFASDLDIGIARWNKVRAMESLLPEAGLPPKALASYTSQWQVVASTMAGVHGALDAGDDKALGELLGRLKPAFTKTFLLFGAFPQ